jgi:hypothetical protein
MDSPCRVGRRLKKFQIRKKPRGVKFGSTKSNNMGGWSSVQEQRDYLAPRIRRWYPGFVTGGERYRQLLHQCANKSTIVLDAGAGDGGYVHELKGRVAKIIGVLKQEQSMEINAKVKDI